MICLYGPHGCGPCDAIAAREPNRLAACLLVCLFAAINLPSIIVTGWHGVMCVSVCFIVRNILLIKNRSHQQQHAMSPDYSLAVAIYDTRRSNKRDEDKESGPASSHYLRRYSTAATLSRRR